MEINSAMRLNPELRSNQLLRPAQKPLNITTSIRDKVSFSANDSGMTIQKRDRSGAVGNLIGAAATFVVEAPVNAFNGVKNVFARGNHPGAEGLSDNPFANATYIF